MARPSPRVAERARFSGHSNWFALKHPMLSRHPERSEGSKGELPASPNCKLSRGSFASLRMTVRGAVASIAAIIALPVGFALEKPDTTYQVFQFPADKIP